MAYVRQHGNQLAIVHGERDPETGKVHQRILFTFYSRKEALAALANGDEGQAGLLRSLLEAEYPEVRFPWKRIWWAVARNLEVLPEDYQYREAQMVERFRADLCSFTRQLVLSEPQWLFSSAELLRQHRYELEYLVELIRWRLKLCETKPDEWNRDNEFCWRLRLRGSEVPGDSEEEVAALYERGDLERAEAVFRLLVDSFENYAEGHNYLGLIALDRGNLDEAARRFTSMIELSRKRLPRRLTPGLFQGNHRGKPYRRGLSNLIITFNRLGRYDEALALSQQLECDCGDLAGAESHRAAIHLNRGVWDEAARAARHVCRLWPEESFIAALASFEMGRVEEAVADFLHGACNHPGAAQLIAGRRPKAPGTHDEARDMPAGHAVLREIAAYLARNGSRARRFFRCVTAAPEFGAVMSEVEETRRRRDEERRTHLREALDRLQYMESPEFAASRAAKTVGSLRQARSRERGVRA